MRKTLISIALATLALASCKKDANIDPGKNANFEPGKGPVKSNIATEVQDTIPDHAAFKLRLAKDSTNRDETMIMFDHKASRNYCAGNDALYFPGFGKVSLSSISADGKNMAIYTLPYKPGVTIGLFINTKADGDYSLALDYQNKMPEHLHVWIRDAYLKDSADVCTGGYNFKVIKADTNSFGSKRFSLVFKQVQPH